MFVVKVAYNANSRLIFATNDVAIASVLAEKGIDHILVTGNFTLSNFKRNNQPDH